MLLKHSKENRISLRMFQIGSTACSVRMLSFSCKNRNPVALFLKLILSSVSMRNDVVLCTASSLIQKCFISFLFFFKRKSLSTGV